MLGIGNQGLELIQQLIKETKKNKIKWRELSLNTKNRLRENSFGRIINGYESKYKDVSIGVYLREYERFNNEYGIYVENKVVEFFLSEQENIMHIFNNEVYGYNEDMDLEIYRLYKLAEANAGNINAIMNKLLS